MACVVVLSLMRTLELEFLQPMPRPILQQKELIPCNKDLVLSLYKKLGFLMELFDENRMDGVEAIKDLETKLRDVAIRIEDEIELQVVHLYQEEREEEFKIFAGIIGIFKRIVDQAFRTPENHIYLEMPEGIAGEKSSTHHCQRLHQILHPLRGKSHPCLKFRRILHRAVQHINAITQELTKTKEEYQFFKHHLQGTKQAVPLHVLPIHTYQVITMPDSSHHASRSKEIMVGKHDEFQIIKEMLRHPSKQLEIVSIKGMGGIGKTTLARQIYEHSSITSYFDKRAWTVASQHHSKRQMLLDLLGSKDNNADKRSDEELVTELNRSLKGRRYMVVMDDVWSKEAWDAVKTYFPNDQNGSRVLLTTRLAEVANHTRSKDDFSHQMRLLEQSESWELFNEKACKSHGAEFERIGRPVVEKCKGLPLAIIVVAGLFSKLTTLDEWKNTANALSSSSATTIDDEECSRILSLSYTHLPHNLKASFLYLGVFPEDKEINANDLARLWAAEGLIKALKNESFEAVARRYIKELTDRNLILVSKRSCCGRKIKAFKLHDLLHEFCVREAQNQSLLHVVYESGSNFPQKGVRWVRIQSKGFDISVLHYCTKNCRSIFYFVRDVVCLDLKSFNNLWRVLYCAKGFYMQGKTLDLIHLRYLCEYGLRMVIDDILPFKTWNLQTVGNKYSYSGRNILEFPQLQYTHSYRFNGASPKSVHQNLQTIFSLMPTQCTQEYLSKLPYLKKVTMSVESNRDWNECTKNLSCLQQLESLRINFTVRNHVRSRGRPNIIPIGNKVLLLKHLRKLAFHYMKFEWKEIKVLSELPWLEVLKLFDSMVGEMWELQENVNFCKLIYLKISSSHLKHWEASAYNFPKLEHLSLWNCIKLREIPIDFVDISTLKSIELYKCLLSAVKSAQKIQDELHEYGNENMVFIEEETLKPSSDEDEE